MCRDRSRNVRRSVLDLPWLERSVADLSSECRTHSAGQRSLTFPWISKKGGSRPPKGSDRTEMQLQATKSRPRALILGAGGHGRVVLDILLQARTCEVVGFLDNNRDVHGRRIDGLPVIGAIDDIEALTAQHNVTRAIIAIGDNGVRRGLARKLDSLGLELISAIHPSATIARNASIGRNVVIAAGAVVCANCQIGDSVILNTGCIVDHQTMIGEGTHICPGVRVAGRVKVEPGAFVGIGATIVPSVTLGCESIIGAGSVVLEDVPPLATVVGVPARAVRLASASEDEAAMLMPAQSL